MRKFKVFVNGKKYDVEIEEITGATVSEQVTTVAAPAPQQVAQPAKPAEEPAKKETEVQVQDGVEKILAPLPGTVLEVCVNNGDSVKSGQVLFILEALKMENEILAPREGIIDKVAVAKGASVEAGGLLATFK